MVATAMKRTIISIFILITMCLCGCSESETKQIRIPKCAMCGSTNTSRGITTTKYDKELGKNISVNYDFCDDCYKKYENVQLDAEIYAYVYTYALGGLEDIKVKLENRNNDSDIGYVVIDKSGIHYKNLGNHFCEYLDRQLSNKFGKSFAKEVCTTQEYTIRIENGDVIKENPPVNPLDQLQ